MSMRKILITLSTFSLASLFLNYCGNHKIPILETEIKDLQKKNQDLRDKLILNKKNEMSVLKVREYLRCLRETLKDLNNSKENINELKNVLDEIESIKEILNRIVNNDSNIKEIPQIRDEHKKINFSEEVTQIIREDDIKPIKIDLKLEVDEECINDLDGHNIGTPLPERTMSTSSSDNSLDESSIEIIDN
jgi:hypothetical protein